MAIGLLIYYWKEIVAYIKKVVFKVFNKIKGLWTELTDAFKDEGILGVFKKIGSFILRYFTAPIRYGLEAIHNLTGAEWAKTSLDKINTSIYGPKKPTPNTVYASSISL